jgi:hypothetical protein
MEGARPYIVNWMGRRPLCNSEGSPKPRRLSADQVGERYPRRIQTTRRAMRRWAAGPEHGVDAFWEMVLQGSISPAQT